MDLMQGEQRKILSCTHWASFSDLSGVVPTSDTLASQAAARSSM